MSAPLSKESDDVVAIHICESCGGLNRTKFESHTQVHKATGTGVCGSCGRGPITLVYGAAEPFDAIIQGIRDAYCRGEVSTCYRIRNSDEWDLYVKIAIKEVIEEVIDEIDEKELEIDIDECPEPIEAIEDSLHAVGYKHTFGEKSDPPEHEEELWDFYVPVKISYPNKGEKPPTFEEFLNEDTS